MNKSSCQRILRRELFILSKFIDRFDNKIVYSYSSSEHFTQKIALFLASNLIGNSDIMIKILDASARFGF